MSNINAKLAATTLLLSEQKTNRTQLNKLLFFADVAYLLSHDQTITGEQYTCLPFGPVPQDIESVRHWLVSKNYLDANHEDYVGWREYSYVASDKVDMGKVSRVLSNDQVEIIKKVRDALGGVSASALSEKSHEFKPWKEAALFSAVDLNKAKEDDSLRDWLKEKKILA